MLVQELVLDEDSVWKWRCFAHGVTSLDGWNVSCFRDIYRTLLHKYGHLLGRLLSRQPA